MAVLANPREDYLIEEMQMYFPWIARDIEDYQITEIGVFARLRDGRTVHYDDFEKTIRTLPSDTSSMTEKEYTREFGIRLRKILRHRMMTQEDLAIATGIDRPLISRYMNGKTCPTFYTIDKIARALGISADDLRYI